MGCRCPSLRNHRARCDSSLLRAERAKHQRETGATASLWPEPEDDTTLVIGHWQFVGQDYRLIPPSPESVGRPAGPEPAMAHSISNVK